MAHSDSSPKRRPTRAAILAEAKVPTTNLDAALESVRQLGYARMRFLQSGILSPGLTHGEKPIAMISFSGPYAETEILRGVELLQKTSEKITCKPPHYIDNVSTADPLKLSQVAV